jgi:hypothetical protein
MDNKTRKRATENVKRMKGYYVLKEGATWRRPTVYHFAACWIPLHRGPRLGACIPAEIRPGCCRG